MTTNPRKTLAETLAAVVMDPTTGVEGRSQGVIHVARDERNPYALTATLAERKFRVIVKEIA